MVVKDLPVSFLTYSTEEGQVLEGSPSKNFMILRISQEHEVEYIPETSIDPNTWENSIPNKDNDSVTIRLLYELKTGVTLGCTKGVE